jgi:glycosyltransferase involved in cell wall biosynthesis
MFWVVALRKPAIWDPHDYYHERLRKSKRMIGRFSSIEIMERIVMAWGTPALVVSNGMREKFAAMYPGADIHTIYNYSSRPDQDSAVSIDDRTERLIRLRNKSQRGVTRIVYPGLIKSERLEPEFLIAVGKLKNVWLDIFGEDRSGVYQEKLNRLLVDHRIENVSMKGRYRSENVVSVLREYHFAIFPFPITYSNIDFCLPNKFYQCVEAGLPMIMTNMKELSAIVERFGLGYLFPSGDYCAYANVQSSCDVDSNQYNTLIRNVLLYGENQINYADQQAELLRVYSTAQLSYKRG